MKKIEGFSQFLTLKNDPENQNCAKFDLHFQSDLSNHVIFYGRFLRGMSLLINQ